MAGDGLIATADVNRIEAPVTVKAYLMCAFASFGGIFFGYDSGYISGVMGMPFFINLYEGIPYLPANPTAAEQNAFTLPAWKKSLITSILSAGTFFGALMAGDLADWFGRRTTIILGCFVFIIGVILQTASHGLGLLVAGRLIAGFGVGFVSAIIILYMSEIAPKKVRGALVSGYQFCITIGILLASCVDYGTQNRRDTGSYRIPIGIQMLWAIILATGLFLLPESPRYFVKKGNLEKATHVLTQLRGEPEGSEYIQQELAEIVANNEYELSVIPSGGYFKSWANCFSGGFFVPSSNIRRTLLGISLQMMQQWTGINFIFYFGTTFFQELKTIKNPFLISLVTTLVNVCSTPISFYIIEKYGRRRILIWGAVGMVICEFIVGIVGVTKGRVSQNDPAAVRAQIAFICFYIFFFATTWGPGKFALDFFSLLMIFANPSLPQLPGSSSAKSFPFPSALVVLRFPLLATGSGIASSPSSPRTWSEPTRATPTSNLVSSSSGDPSAPSASSMHTFSFLRPRACLLSRLTVCSKRLLLVHLPDGSLTAHSLPIWV